MMNYLVLSLLETGRNRCSSSGESQGYALDVSRQDVEGYDAVYSASVNACVVTDFSYCEGL